MLHCTGSRALSSPRSDAMLCRSPSLLSLTLDKHGKQRTPSLDAAKSTNAPKTRGESVFCFGEGTADQRSITLTEDPEDAANQVLYMVIHEPNENVHDNDDVACNGEPTGARRARAQHVLQHNSAIEEFNYRVRVRLGDGFQALVDGPYRITWLTLGEFWNNLSTEENSFRVSLNLVK